MVSLSFLAFVLSTLSFTWAQTESSATGAVRKIYGVNIGNWLVFEPWMAEQRWKNMGGQQCNDCAACIRSEWSLVKSKPRDADRVFNDHWNTWFTEQDVNQLASAGINTVRIPLGYWLVEPLVNRASEFYPRGGFAQLKRGLRMLKNRNIQVILDHHALPGVAAEKQMFAGNCSSNTQFYTRYNYQRALVWTAVMTVFSHLDPDFSKVFSLQAVNEPVMDASKTPGYGQFQIDFVHTIRAAELALGIPVKGIPASDVPTSNRSPNNIATTLLRVARHPAISRDVREAISASISPLTEMASKYNVRGLNNFAGTRRQSLVSNFMDIGWQYNEPSNPADAALGPQAYDNHLYYSFGGVADASEEAYMRHICNLNRIQVNRNLGNSPLWFGEWALSTNFNATDAFLKNWADAQKMAYSQGAGWIFWNFKIEISELEGDFARQWSYLEGLRRGYLTRDPSKYNNPRVCDSYRSR